MLNPRLLLLILALVLTASSWATVPQSLSFQGYLTDRLGSPIADSQTIKFSIYTVPVGGVPVWEETKSVAFSNGLFSTRLGELVAFPPDLFNVPLWIGMTVGTDSEMEPRRPLTSAGFSFRAEDSDTLQGQSAAELDQSFHVDDLGNPHAVSAAQTGAATQAGLDAHATDGSNPHGVSVSQTGGVDAGLYGLHVADQSAHHTEYTDAEAVAAMGANDASNALNHDRYSDGESVAAILAADGPGSGLDADLLDGTEADDFNAAISANTDGIATNADAIGENANAIETNSDGIASLPAAAAEGMDMWIGLMRTLFVPHSNDCDAATEAFVQIHPGGIGYCIERDERAAKRWVDARQECLADNKRLPEPIEWLVACEMRVALGLNDIVPPVGVDSAEWISNFPVIRDDGQVTTQSSATDANAQELCSAKGTQILMTTMGVSQAQTWPYRCVR